MNDVATFLLIVVGFAVWWNRKDIFSLFGTEDKPRAKVYETQDDVTELVFPMTPEQSRKLYASLIQNGRYEEMEAIRSVEIMTESLAIANDSKNEETIKSRIELAKEHFEALTTKHNGMFIEMVKDDYERLLKKAYTALYIAPATKAIEKSKTLKQAKSKEKYKLQAIELLEKGLQDPKANHEKISKMLNEIKENNE